MSLVPGALLMTVLSCVVVARAGGGS